MFIAADEFLIKNGGEKFVVVGYRLGWVWLLGYRVYVDREFVGRVQNVWHLESDFCNGTATTADWLIDWLTD